MLTVRRDATDADILRAVEEWLRLLEDEEYERAAEAVNLPGQAPWTPELLTKVVKRYNRANPATRITSSGESASRRLRREVQWFDDDDATAGFVWFDLYVDHRQSDLTATFDILRAGDRLNLSLIDIHVM